MKELILIHKDDVTYIDHSKKLDLLRDDFTIDYTTAEDELYLGLYKQFSQAYLELAEVANADVQMQFSYFNGSTWQPINISDDTLGLTRSGFWKVEKPNDWASSMVNGKEAFWIKVTADTFEAAFAGIDIVYSDDHDLKTEFRDALDYIAKGDRSLIAYHVAARNEIVNAMRVGGYSVPTELLNTNFKQFTKWDFLNPIEIKQASTYLALSKLMFDVSVNNDDKFYSKYQDYLGKFGEAFRLAYMSLDSNDNGVEDDILQDTNGRTYKV
jgi:hypothetical protein